MTADAELLLNGPADAGCTLALAHGAGAGMDTAFLEFFAAALADRGNRVVRFEFPYMAGKRTTGKKKPPDSAAVLRETWLRVVGLVRQGGGKVIIGGKSMGGRIASLIADEANVDGLVCLGYPFHPVGKPDRLRVEHLQTIRTPTLILQGERDPFGNRDDVAGYNLAASVQVVWLPNGNHDFTPRKASGRTEQQNWADAATALDKFLQSRTRE